MHIIMCTFCCRFFICQGRRNDCGCRRRNRCSNGHCSRRRSRRYRCCCRVHRRRRQASKGRIQTMDGIYLIFHHCDITVLFHHHITSIQSLVIITDIHHCKNRTNLRRDMRFLTMWHFDMNSLMCSLLLSLETLNDVQSVAYSHIIFK